MEITRVPHDTAGLCRLDSHASVVAHLGRLSLCDSHASVVLTRMRVRWQAAVKIDGDYLDARNNVGAAQTQLLVSLALFCSLLLSLLLSLALSWSLLVSLGLSWSARDCPSFRVSVCLSACVCVCVYLCVRVYCGGSLCGDAFDATAATPEPCVPMPPTHCVVKAPTVMPRGLGRMARQGCIACLVCMPRVCVCVCVDKVALPALFACRN